ncbi:MAG: tyrosine-type recombinase/integrase [Proteobacteria bacterium]|nr:tyrosine-type recombinase/integrase [Pseudomonadota bacterium]
MASRKARITKPAVGALKPGSILWDTDVKGFGVRCQRRDKVYFLKTSIRGKQRWLTIGPHGSPWTPEKARNEAKRKQGYIADGKDPAKERADAKDQPTMADLCKRYLEEYAGEHKKPSSARADTSNINNHVLPLLGAEFVSDVTRADIDRFKRSVKDGKTARERGPERRGGIAVRGGAGAANRCLALLSKIFNLAERWGWRPDGTNPVRHVDKYPEGKRERYLSEAEIAALADTLKGIEKTEGPFTVAAVRLLLFTGARLGEILSLKWEYVSLDAARLTLPDSKTGAKVVYLSAPALDVLANLLQFEDNPHVICGHIKGAALVNLQKPWSRIREKATIKLLSEDAQLGPLVTEMTSKDGEPSLADIEAEAKIRKLTVPKGIMDVRLHDLRHSYASIGASGGLSLPMIGKLLGHTQAATTARYAHLADDPLRAANEAIGQRIAAAMKGDTNSAEIITLPK